MAVAVADDLRTSPRRQVVAATVRCIARWGIAKTTLEDIARDAGLSRATVYRLFPGGKDVLLGAVVADEVAAFTGALRQRLAAAGSLEDVVVEAVLAAAEALNGHPALRFVIDHEPEQLLPHVSFDRFDGLLSAAADLAAPYLDARTAEWVTRLVLSYALSPSRHVALDDEASVRRFVRTFLLPALQPEE